MVRAAQRAHGLEVARRELHFYRFARYRFPGASVPGFTEFLYWGISTLSRAQTQTASHFQKEPVSRKSSIVQLIPQLFSGYIT